jgi:type I restriction-modification system DNA methylase subunit
LTRDEAKKKLVELVNQFQNDSDVDSLHETDLRNNYVDRLIEYLGYSNNGKTRNEWEVFTETKTNERQQKKVDYSIKLNNEFQFLIEAKKPKVDIKIDKLAIFQIKNYSFHKNVPIGILTNFKTFKVFFTFTQPSINVPKSGLILEFDYTEYVSRFDEFYNLFSKEFVLQDSLINLIIKNMPQLKKVDKEAVQLKMFKEKGREELDNSFLSFLDLWREKIAQSIASKNPTLTVKEIIGYTQKFIDRILFIKICEDREILPFESLMSFIKQKQKVFNFLLDSFATLNEQFNGSLFSTADKLEEIEIEDDILEDFIKSFYFTDGFETPKYLFYDIKVEILGNIYERFLGNTIVLAKNRKVTIEETPATKKADGVFYTPQYIVSYIIENTVGEKIRSCKTLKEVSEIKIIDPACGSGSFLLGAYGYLIKWYENYFELHPEEGIRKTTKTTGKGKSKIIEDVEERAFRKFDDGSIKLKTYKKSEILKNHIFGVDIDPQAVEVTKLSLYIKMIEEGKLQLNIVSSAILPSMNDNIKCGNSLIGNDIYHGETLSLFMEAEKEKINAFDWDSEKFGFKNIFLKRQGFDVVISNPPWGATLLENEKKYLMNKYEHIHMRTPDTFNYFMGKNIELLSEDGIFGIIIPNNFLFQHEYAKSRAYFISNHDFSQAINLGDGVFKKAAVPSCIIIVRNKSQKNSQIFIKDLRSFSRDDLENSLINVTGTLVKSTEILNYPDSIILMKNASSTLLVKLLGNKRSLNEIAIEVAAGIGTGGDKVFRVENSIVKKLKLEQDIIHPVIVGRELFDYYVPKKTGYSIIYSTKKISKKTHPKIYDYLLPYQKQLSKKRETRKGMIPWWSLHWPRYPELFDSPKIILRQTNDTLCAALDNYGYYCLNSIIIIKLNDEKLNEYIVALLNSKLMRWIYKSLTQEENRAFAEVKPINLRKLPIISEFDNGSIEHFNNIKISHSKILALIKESGTNDLINREIDFLQNFIDQHVYQLYNLTENEISIIEESFKLEIK